MRPRTTFGNCKEMAGMGEGWAVVSIEIVATDLNDGNDGAVKLSSLLLLSLSTLFLTLFLFYFS